jgi:uncharacterized protein
MEQRLTMLMFAVDDLARSCIFYENGLGWQSWGAHRSKVSAKYMASGVVVTLIDRAYLSREAGLPPASGTIGIVPVINVAQQAEVDRVADEVISAGGSVSSPPRFRDGGLYSFYFTDPDKNPWEVVWSPNMPMDDNGVLMKPK